MTIKRIVNGKTHDFELTKEELFRAYEEQQYIWDLEAAEQKKDILLEAGVPSEKIKEAIDFVACDMRRSVRKYDVDEEYAMDEAIVAATERFSVKEELI